LCILHSHRARAYCRAAEGSTTAGVWITFSGQ
jgi:hypothetical protein